MMQYLYPVEQQTITPEMETVLDMMRGLSREGQEKIVESLYEMISELQSETSWKTLLEKQPEYMDEMAAQALKEHREKKTRPL